MTATNYYDILGVAPDMDGEGLRQTISQLSASWSKRASMATSMEKRHEAERTLRQITEAKQVLLDPASRAAYDAELERSFVVAKVADGEARRPCRACGESILAIAKKCRYCHEWLSLPEPNPEILSRESLPTVNNASLEPGPLERDPGPPSTHAIEVPLSAPRRDSAMPSHFPPAEDTGLWAMGVIALSTVIVCLYLLLWGLKGNTTSSPSVSTVPVSQASDGAAIFEANCKMCHGVTGTQIPNVALFDLEFVAPRDLTNIVTNGQGGMPSFEGRLSSEEIATVAAWVRSQAR